MYRIELSPGEETVFRSIEELAVAIKRGVITPRARIYHNASNKWLPIQFHPHYKAAVSMPLTQAALVAGPPVKPLSSLSLEEQELETSEPPPALIPMMSPKAEPTRERTARSAPTGSRKRKRVYTKPRRQLRIALVGALLVGGAQWVLSAPLFSRTDIGLVHAQRHLIASPAAALSQVSAPNSAAMIPVLPSSSTTPTSAPLEGLTPSRRRVTVPSFGGTAAAAGTGVGLTVEPRPAAEAQTPTTPADSDSSKAPPNAEPVAGSR